jgi:lysophospholipase L1-like esterase
MSALAIAAMSLAGFAILRPPAPSAPTIDMARAEAAEKAAEQARADRDREALEAATVPLNFPTDGPLRVLYSGDSVTAGYYSTTEATSYRALVTSALREHGPVEEVATYKAGATVPYITEKFPKPENIDLAIVMLGTNDSRTEGNDPAVFGQQYSAYLASIKAASPDAQILCLGIWAPTVLSTRPYVEQIPVQCEANGGRFVDLSSSYSASSVLSGPAGVTTWQGPSDVTHPNDNGHRTIADEILKRIRR